MAAGGTGRQWINLRLGGSVAHLLHDGAQRDVGRLAIVDDEPLRPAARDTLIETAKFSGRNPEACLGHVIDQLARCG